MTGPIYETRSKTGANLSGAGILASNPPANAPGGLIMKSNMPRLSKAVAACALVSSFTSGAAQRVSGNSFGEVVSFVNQHSKLLVLSDEGSGASIAVWPAMQGCVLTSSAAGPGGLSFGWINRELIASGKVQQHINAVGGEDRIWVGPEGGQFSVFFAPGAPFDLNHWYTPTPIDTEPFKIVSQTNTSVALRSAFSLTNYTGTMFEAQIDRQVRLLPEAEVWRGLRVAAVKGVKVVGYESVNKLNNLSEVSWRKETGLLSLWVLGQFQSSPQTTIVLPIRDGSTAELGIPVTSDYFGEVPGDRIAVRSNVVFLKADSNYRSKLGLSLQRAKGILGSYDAQNHVLTIVQYSQPSEPAEYVNSAWRIQKDPYKGDVANCYNDGPPSPGKPQLGHFYELESSSPARVLGAHEAVEHTQRTIHLVGTEQQLDAVSRATLGVGLEEVREFNH